MSVLFSILELNEVVFMFLTLAIIITFSQFCSYITSLLGHRSFIQMAFLELLSCYGLVLATENGITKGETWSLDSRSLYFRKQKNETIKQSYEVLYDAIPRGHVEGGEQHRK